MKLQKVLCLVMIVAMAPMALTGCFGSFELWHKVHDWNNEISENKWAKEGMFLVLSFFPVYFFAMFADMLVMNSIEFWTDEGPYAGEGALPVKELIGANGERGTMTLRPDGAIDFTVVSEEGVQTVTFVRDGDTLTALKDGEIFATVKNVDGKAVLVD